MRTSTRTDWLLVIGFVIGVLLIPARAAADLIWFDETNGARDYSTFGALHTAYAGFLGASDVTLDLVGLPEGTKLSDQYEADFGVTFLNTAGGRYDGASGARAESGGYVEDLTGYDGSYMPNGRMVYLKFDNNAPNTPFTLQFGRPVAQIGSFMAVGKEGTVHSLTVSAYDSEDQLVGRKVVQSWLWDTVTARQNFETFFAVRADSAAISRVEILNDSPTDFSNALLVDNVEFGRQAPGMAPEASALALFGSGAVVLFLPRARRAVMKNVG